MDVRRTLALRVSNARQEEKRIQKENSRHNKIHRLEEYVFYDNCENSRALIGLFLSSICGQTHEFEIRATRQRARVGNSTICYRKKQLMSVFHASVLLLTMNFVITLSK